MKTKTEETLSLDAKKYILEEVYVTVNRALHRLSSLKIRGLGGPLNATHMTVTLTTVGTPIDSKGMIAATAGLDGTSYLDSVVGEAVTRIFHETAVVEKSSFETSRQMTIVSYLIRV
jgi:hypothetical protein